jgi:carbon monoxide dehydrogenase subunit G
VRTTFPIDAPPTTWAALSDPEVLAAALPGCRSVTATGDGDGTLHVVAELSVASVHGLWAGSVVRVDADSLRIAGSGEPGTVDLVVRSDPSRTALTVEGTVAGPLATVGSAVLAAVIRRIAEDLLAAAAAPTPSVPTRGDGFPSTEPEDMGSRSGTNGLGLGAPEPMPSGGRSHRRVPGRLPGRAAALAGVVVVVVLGRRRARRRAG